MQLTKRRPTLELLAVEVIMLFKNWGRYFFILPGNCADDDRFKLNIIPDKPIENKTLNARFKAIKKSGPKVPVTFYKARKSLRKDI